MRLDRIQQLCAEIKKSCARFGRDIQVMEVCGTHTVALFRFGIRSLLPNNLKLLSGPGCPVCVTEQGYIDMALELAGRDDCIIATYGDMLRVPGGRGSLEKLARKNVRVILSADDAVKIARQNPDRTIVFVAVGFETTAPATAVAVREAQRLGLENFTILCGHKRVLPAMEALLSGRNDRIDAFLCPGHVSVIIGSDVYNVIVGRFKKPCAVAGFEAGQILSGLAEICRQIDSGIVSVSSVYSPIVAPQGNKIAQSLIGEFFEPADGQWRGLGVIPAGCMKLRPQFGHFDATERFGLRIKDSPEPDGCRCGQVLCGLLEPQQCPLFGKNCTPEHPVGPCMVSTEGACAAWYRYGR